MKRVVVTGLGRLFFKDSITFTTFFSILVLYCSSGVKIKGRDGQWAGRVFWDCGMLNAFFVK